MPFGTISSGSVADGVDTGSIDASVGARIAEGLITGTDSMSLTGGSTMLAVMSRWTIASGKQWSLQVSTGADTTETGTSVSATGSTFSVAPNDVIVVGVSIKSDTVTHSSQTVTLAGATLSAMNWQTVFTTTTGNDCAMYVGYCT